MEKRLVLFLLILASLIVKLAHAAEFNTSTYPPDQLVWLRIHDYNATLPQSILSLHASLINEEQTKYRSTTPKQALLAECSALHRALTNIEKFANEDAFGDWSFILPTNELRDWYASVVLHHHLTRAINEADSISITLLRALYEEYVCTISDTTPPYLIIIDRKKLIDALKDLLDSYE